ncbi:MAG: hypothetical protein HKN43_09475 [Rhodothermales bacterium]|nr:hypothetical protein [Rhodothermales bacterium]
MKYLYISFLCLSTSMYSAAQIYELPNPSASVGDYFGSSVAIRNNIALVGANGADLCGANSGAAYIYTFEEETGHWTESASLQPENCLEGMSFGRSVALGDSTAVVSSFRETPIADIPNSVFVFRLQPDGSWKREARLIGSFIGKEGAFASSLSMHGERIAISSSGDASARQYGGSVYIFERNSDGRWKETHRITVPRERSSGIFGGEAVLSGDFLAVTAPSYSDNGKGSLYVFEFDQGEWVLSNRFRGLDDYTLTMDASDSFIIVGEKSDGDDSSGSATLFVRNDDGDWTRKQILKPVSPFELGAFGTGVAVSDDLALVVGYDEQLQFEFNIDRVVYVFGYDQDGGYWRQRHIVDIGDVFFGSALDIDKRVALIGRASDTTVGQAVIVHLH